ncbi:2-phospho-L-lactate transferase [Nakamurella sp.]|uniref:2-phospho-L-lactate transferase n=1 Tax=Nakamurella sp. TaxID=1869182 RepID=UPI00378367F8
MRIAVLAGGVGGAKFLLGVKRYLGWPAFGPPGPGDTTGSDHRITAIVNTADDIRLHNLQVCPDLDSCMYTLAGISDLQRGWGRADETWTVSSELAGYDAEAPWFSLGDRDIATHLVRTRMLDAGYRLSDVTDALCRRWQPGVTLLPMSDDRVETHVVVEDPTVLPDAAGSAAPLVALHFQEWWIRYQAKLPAMSITPIGAADATPAPGVLEAIDGADLVLVAPSNPVVSVGPILAVPGIAEAIRTTSAPVVGVSPIIGTAPVRGHADKCLEAVGVPVSAQGVGRHYGARSDGGLLDAYLIAGGETATIPGVTVAARPLLMTDPDRTATMVAACAEIAGVAGRG